MRRAHGADSSASLSIRRIHYSAELAHSCVRQECAALSPAPVFIRLNRRPRFPVGLPPPLRLPLVPVLLAFGQRQLALHPPLAEIEPGGDERMPLDLRLRE